jgi:hypothetical protein
MTNQETGKILIVVRGGVVQSVFSSNKNLKVDLLDFDNEVFQDEESAKRAFERRKNNLTEIIV